MFAVLNLASSGFCALHCHRYALNLVIWTTIKTKTKSVSMRLRIDTVLPRQNEAEFDRLMSIHDDDDDDDTAMARRT
jgi:hypothetical protein